MLVRAGGDAFDMSGDIAAFDGKAAAMAGDQAQGVFVNLNGERLKSHEIRLGPRIVRCNMNGFPAHSLSMRNEVNI
jgi:hypothetical protein